MGKQRDQLCPVWLTALLGTGITLALAVSYPTEDSLSHRVAASPASEVSVAYVEGLLRLRPDSTAYLNSLAIQHLKLGDWDSAFAIADRLKQQATNAEARRQALLLEALASEQQAYGFAETDPRRVAAMKRFTEVLKETSGYNWDVATLVELAEKAEDVGAHYVMEALYEKLATTDPAGAQQWHEKRARAALANRGYKKAAFAYLEAFQASTSLDAQRENFLHALGALVAANDPLEACKLAETHLGPLATDRETLRYLVRLARLASRSDLTATYAKALLDLTSPRRKHVVAIASDGPQQRGRSLFGARLYPMSAMAPVAHMEEEEQSEYELVYEAFVETGLLPEAEEAGLRAMEAGEPVGVWAPRLAQLSIWRNHRDKALEYWLMAAHANNDAVAWENVLDLAPELNDVESFLLAWTNLNSDVSGPAAERLAQEDLLARYVKVGNWPAALDLMDVMSIDTDPDSQARLVLLRATAAEQVAYQHEAGTPDREEAMTVFRQALADAAEYEWDVETLGWLAERAQHAAAIDLQEVWMRELAERDPDNAPKWYARIAQAALQRQQYEQAANAYFVAQDMSKEREEKREYFLAGLKAYVASGDVSQACVAAEARRDDLRGDPATLRYLIGLARQAGRADLLATYARELIQITEKGRAGDASRPAKASPASMQAPAADPWSPSGWYAKPAVWRGGQLPIRSAMQWSDMQVQKIQVADDAVGPDPAGSEDDFDLAYQALVQSLQLEEAERTAELALKQGFSPIVWLPRVAQTAEWNAKPAKALHYWLRYAREADDEQAWDKVATMARQLNNESAYLAAAQHAYARDPSDTAKLDDVMRTYERLGQPEQGMAYLKAWAKGPYRRAALERYARLAERAGNKEAALDAYEVLSTEWPDDPLYAMHIALIEHRMGNTEHAMEVMKEARDQATADPEHGPYWQLYAALARKLQLDEDANLAHRQLIASGYANQYDLHDISYFYSDYPVDAARVAEAEFNKTGSTASLYATLQFYGISRAWPHIERILADLTPEQQAVVEQSPQLLAARAAYHFRAGNLEKGLDDLRNAVSLPNATDDIRTAYLWALADFGSINELRRALFLLRDHAERNPLYWGPFAAGELRLGRIDAATFFLRQEASRSGRDPIVVAALATAEEAAGRGDLAWHLRQEAWQKLHTDTGPLAESNEPNTTFKRGVVEAEARDIARAELATQILLADQARALIVEMLEEERALHRDPTLGASILGDVPGLAPVSTVMQRDPETTPTLAGHGGEAMGVSTSFVDRRPIKALVLHWAVEGQHNELARLWLAQEYVPNDPARVDSVAHLAVTKRDKRALNEVLDNNRLSASARLAALTTLHRIPEAQILSYSLAQHAPDSDEQQEQLADLLMLDSQYAGVDVVATSVYPLRYLETALVGKVNLSSRFSVDLRAVYRKQKTRDETLLAWVPSNDRSFEVTLRDITVSRQFALTAGYRDALESFASLRFSAQLNPYGTFRPTLTVGRNQTAYASDIVQVGAVKDMARLDLEWSPEAPWFLHASAEAMRLYSQDRERIGTGYLFAGELGWRFSSRFPDWHVRGIVERGIYSARDGAVVQSMARLLPADIDPIADNIIPQSYTRYGVLVGFGSTDSLDYVRRWRPFLDAGVVHDSNEGWGPQVVTGVGGPILGKDRLTLYFLYQDAAGDGTHSSKQLGLSYRLFF